MATKRPTKNAAPASRLAAAPAALAGATDITALRAAGNGEHAAEECAGRARQIRISATNLQDKADALAQEVRAANLANDCAQIEIDINAASVKVDRLNASDLTALGDLATKLDRQIVASQLLNAVLTGVGQILDSVVKVKDILSDPALR
jgi:hypothetical protein